MGGAPWLSALGTLGGSSNALQEALAQQQVQQAAAAAALQQQAVNAALLQNAAAVQAAVGNSPLAQNAAMQAALQQALINQQVGGAGLSCVSSLPVARFMGVGGRVGCRGAVHVMGLSGVEKACCAAHLFPACSATVFPARPF